MFSFHRPKVYRSSRGCCICKAKSSRFTDSKKYEEDFMECFKLSTPRQGEICNACVLLVKRWKKLPAGSDRNWRHVVDARAGPGIKSVMKCKSKHKKHLEEKPENIKKKYYEREVSPVPSDKSDVNDEIELTTTDFFSDGPSGGSSRTASPGASDCEEAVEKNKKEVVEDEDATNLPVSDFVDLHYWKRESLCCGTIFRGLNNEIMIDPRFMKPCSFRVAQCKLDFRKRNCENNVNDNLASKIYSDNSSDSGYDDSSNQEPSSKCLKKDQVSIGLNIQNTVVD